MRTIRRRKHSSAIRFFLAAVGQLSRSSMLIVQLTILVAGSGGFRPAQAQTAQAVLFFAPTCAHCHEVITQYLPGLFEQNGGAPRVSVDAAVQDADRALYLFYNDQLEILLVDASKSVGTELYLASTENQEVPPERTGVPRLVIGDSVLVGSYEIPQLTGDLVQQGLDSGGLPWPEIDGLKGALEAIPAAASPDVAAVADSAPGADVSPEDSISTEPETTAAEDTARRAEVPDTTLAELDDPTPEPPLNVLRPTGVDTAADARIVDQPETAARDTLVEPIRADAESSFSRVEESGDSQSTAPSVFDMVPEHRSTMLENFGLDPVGNSFSIVVLVVMIVSIVVVGVKSETLPVGWGVGAGIPLLALVGVVVASYLTYVETTGAIAVCGPVGDCNTVNQSEWARLFGILPIGVLGLVGYVVVALAWSVSRYASGKVPVWARLSLGVMTVGGTLFSIYLTFLEPFVIGATCAWCLTSSIVITALMWLSVGAARDAWNRIRDNSAAKS